MNCCQEALGFLIPSTQVTDVFVGRPSFGAFCFISIQLFVTLNVLQSVDICQENTDSIAHRWQ